MNRDPTCGFVLDTVIALRHPADYDPADGAQFEIHFEKSRGIYGDAVKPFIAKLSENSNGQREWSMADYAESTFERVVELRKEGLTGSEIAESLGVNKSTVSRHLARAKKDGKIDG